MSLPKRAAVSENWAPVSCMPSPESPAKRMTTASREVRFLEGLAEGDGGEVAASGAPEASKERSKFMIRPQETQSTRTKGIRLNCLLAKGQAGASEPFCFKLREQSRYLGLFILYG